ncbi:MAG: class I SAM-dependent methyltransferase [Arachnia sp.]
MLRGTMDKLQVSAGFDEVADTYDAMAGLNPGYKRHLRLAAESLLTHVDVTNPRPVLLDLGCGSGLSTSALLAAAHKLGMDPVIIGVDASAGMLAQAQRREWPDDVSFRQGRAEDLAALDLPRADGILACYLLRNVTDVDATLRSIEGQLCDRGTFVAQDYSVADSIASRRVWAAVNQSIILPLASVVARNRDLYEYLHRSVDDFMGVRELAQRILLAGFATVESRSVDGWQNGILHLVRGTKPLA